jgi:hypothetical protein
LALRLALAGVSLLVLFLPSELAAALASIPVIGLIASWLLRQRRAVPAAEPVA